MIAANEAVLTRELQTPLGLFVAGQTVLIVTSNGDKVTVCLDPDGHHSGRCHRATVYRTRLGLPRLWRPETRAA